MKRTQDSKVKIRGTIMPPAGQIKRRRAAISWEAGTNGPIVTVEFISEDRDTFSLLADLFVPLMLRRAPGDGADMILTSHGFKFNPVTRKVSRIAKHESKDLLRLR